MAFSDKLNQGISAEIQIMLKHIEEKHVLINEYISLRKRIKAKSALVEKEQAEMKQMLKEFEKKHQAGGRPDLPPRRNQLPSHRWPGDLWSGRLGSG